ncbi:MAG TPA: hypothetical protein V6C81_18330 [Planktothrix sp.]|jgi:hypothetical protein
MTPPHERASLSRSSGSEKQKADTAWIIEAAIQSFEEQQIAGRPRAVINLEGKLWSSIQPAADELNASGFVVEYGYCWSGTPNERKFRALSLQKRESYIDMQVNRIGIHFLVGAIIGLLVALWGFTWQHCGGSGQLFYVVAAALELLWLGSQATRRSRQRTLRARLESKEWSPIDRFSPHNYMRP